MFPSLNLWLQSKDTARKPTVEKQKDFDGANNLCEEKGMYRIKHHSQYLDIPVPARF